MDILQKILDSNIKLTPMMEQYVSIKKQYPNTLVLYRMGDFYELFFDDAHAAARLLNITLTHRGKLGDAPIPMAGIPFHAASSYVDRLTSRGLKVVICEQMEDPALAKGLVKRAVTQIVGPGIPYDLEKVSALINHYLASAAFDGKYYHLILLDFTTGDFKGLVTTESETFLDKLRAYAPKEFITWMGQWENFPALGRTLEEMGVLKTCLSKEYFDSDFGEVYIEKLIPGFKNDKILNERKGLWGAIAALGHYVLSTQSLEEMVHIRPFRLESEANRLTVTTTTLMGLEILPRSRDRYGDSLLGHMDRTRTSMGAREIRNLFLAPTRSLEVILARQSIIEYFIQKPDILEKIRTLLGDVRDLDRILAKITTKKINANDLGNLAQTVNIWTSLVNTLKKFPKNGVVSLLSDDQSATLLHLAETITKTINDTPGASLEKGNLIKDGANAQRDRLKETSSRAQERLEELELKYRQETGITNLRIRHNNINGHYVEVSKSHLAKVPKDFERRQTLVNGERFVTEELAKFENEILSAEGKLSKLEREIFNKIVFMVSSNSGIIGKLSSAIAILDVFQGFSWTSLQEGFSKPVLNTSRKIMNLSGAWHPLIKARLKDKFVCHDLRLDDSTFFGLITGPNMAGKTTVMREAAIIAFLAQLGSFVPATRAEVSLCDRIFGRLGASDDILKGQSTFMVEMSEMAEIIRHATKDSLIILDEIGRGTSTFDGLSIAWAIVEHLLSRTKALCLFSTHYHELTELISSLPEAKNLTVETTIVGDEIRFLYRLIEKSAGQSFGLYAAQLAGLPRSILSRAGEILKNLETDEVIRAPGSTAQLSFISDDNVAIPPVPPHLLRLEEEIRLLDVLNMTPMKALAKLHELRETIQ